MNCSMLESAEEFAMDWFIRQHVTEREVIEIDDKFARFYGFRPCTCNGGIPMMKRDCPKHGHLVRSTDKR